MRFSGLNKEDINVGDEVRFLNSDESFPYIVIDYKSDNIVGIINMSSGDYHNIQIDYITPTEYQKKINKRNFIIDRLCE